MHIYMKRILQLLPALGIYHLTPQTLVTADTKVNSTARSSTDLNQVFHCRAKGKLAARGRRSQKGFTIFKGSQAVKNPVNSCPERLVKNRAILIETELMAQGEDSPIFTEDYKFSSPSAAAGIIRYRSTNGKCINKPLTFYSNFLSQLKYHKTQ